ncbi:MAG: 50S ribosomal protein L29 [bacterium]
MKIKEITSKDDKALNKLLIETQAKIMKDRFKIASREMTVVSEIAKSRKLVAQIKTIMNEREIVAKEEKQDKNNTGEKK